MATRKNTAPTEAHRLTLVSYPDGLKVTVIKIIRECTGLGLKEAKDLAESLPAVLDVERQEGREAAVNALRAAGAVVTVEPVVTDQEEFLAGIGRHRAFDASPLGEALSETDQAVAAAIALIDCANRSLERDDGNGIDHETAVLEIALERLREAAEALDKGHGIAARAYRPAEVQP